MEPTYEERIVYPAIRPLTRGATPATDPKPPNEPRKYPKYTLPELEDLQGEKEEHRLDIKTSDDFQYEEYTPMLEVGCAQRRTSFPVSSESAECNNFNEYLEGFVSCLQRSKAQWLSIDCLGRIWSSEHDKPRIRTTIVNQHAQYCCRQL
ncbi:hypothetical protein F4679DRAFT_533257 [Xylaria curta]|nr:hypothetical protein F4679DRAFT_533257 [Xylaria curta]